MKSPTLLMIGLGLVGAALMPATCRAQSEIDPDHFEMTNVEPIDRPSQTATVNLGREQKQVTNGMAGYDHLCTTPTALEEDESADARFKFKLFGFTVVIEGNKHAKITEIRNRLNTAERVWKQLVAKLEQLA